MERESIKEQQVMETVPVFVGLDDHSRSVQVCVMDQQGKVLVNRHSGNSVVEIAAAVGSGRGGRCSGPRSRPAAARRTRVRCR